MTRLRLFPLRRGKPIGHRDDLGIVTRWPVVGQHIMGLSAGDLGDETLYKLGAPFGVGSVSAERFLAEHVVAYAVSFSAGQRYASV